MVPMTHRFLIMFNRKKPSSYWGLIILSHSHLRFFLGVGLNLDRKNTIETWDRMGCNTFEYGSVDPEVIKHGIGKCTIFNLYVNFPLKPLFMRDFPLPCLITRGYMILHCDQRVICYGLTQRQQPGESMGLGNDEMFPIHLVDHLTRALLYESMFF